MFLIGGTTVSILCALSAFLGPDLPSVITVLFGCVTVGVVLKTSQRLAPDERRPWRTVALAGGLFVARGVGLIIYVVATGAEEVPKVSVFDAFAFAGYFVLILFILRLSRLRSPERDLEGLIDGFIVAVAASVILWAAFLAPYMRDTSYPGGERAINAAYSLCTIVLMAVTTRLAVGPGARTPSFYFLATAIALTVVSDVSLTLRTVGTTSFDLANILLPMVWVFYGTASLHPTRTKITQPPEDTEAGLTLRRQFLLTVALLMAPGVLIWQLNSGDQVDLPVVVAGSVLLSLLVLLRLTMLVRAKERAALHEYILREASSVLVSTTDRADMNSAARWAVTQLVTDDPELRVSVAVGNRAGIDIVDAGGHLAEQAAGRHLDLDNLPAKVAEGLRNYHPVLLLDTPALDLGPTADPQLRSVFAAPLVSQNELRGAIVTTTARPLHRSVRQAIEALAATVSLALDSADLRVAVLRRQSEARFRTLVENSSDIVVVIDEHRHITYTTPSCQRLLGVAEEDLLGTDPIDRVHEDDRDIAYSIFVHPYPAVALEPVELRLLHADGTPRWFEIEARDLRHEPDIDGVVLDCRDVTDRREAKQQLAASEARFRALVQHSSDLVCVIDPEGVFTFVSPSVTEMLGYHPRELEGTNAVDLLDPTEQRAIGPRMLDMRSSAERHGTFPTQSVEVRLADRSAVWHTLDITITDLRHEEAIGGIVLNARDVTIRKALEHDLRHQALHDALTGLGNRALFTERVDQALHNTHHRRLVAVLFIDLDDFKTVNDSLGHAVGDELLIRVADRLRTCLHPADTAARLGGDEFAVLIETPGLESHVITAAERILLAMRAPFDIQDREIGISTSIGIAFDHDRTSGAEELLRNADMAMYLAKEKGKARAEVFEERMHATVYERLELKADLARGIETGQLHLLYQPIVSLQTGRITGAEALVRWDHPERGRLSPTQFIPLAEDTGLIELLGTWVLEEACQQLRAWQLELPAGAAMSMSVNMSVRQLQDEGIVEQVRGVVDRFGLTPSTLNLEITETMLMRDVELGRRRLGELRQIGVSLAVDDFGTGYSSLGYIQRFPVNVIKIDRSFVENLDGDRANTVVVESMIELANRLGVHIVAEGIEHFEQLRILQSLGCDLGQGYWFARPVEAEELARLLALSMRDGSRFLGRPL